MVPTITQIQNAIDAQTNDPRQLINMVVDYLQANPSGGALPYLSYISILSQSNADVNTIVVREQQNTMGNVPWIRDSLGTYIGTMSDIVLTQEQQIWIGGFVPEFANNTVIIPITDFATIIGYYRLTTIANLNSNSIPQIYLETIDSSMQYVEFLTLIGNGNAYLCLPEIRIYPAQ